MSAGRAFGDPDLTPDNFGSFSKQEISADSAAKGLEQLEPVPPARSTTPMELASVIGDDVVQKIQKAGKITFHTVGDTGGIDRPQFQFAVADAMADDQPTAEPPSGIISATWFIISARSNITSSSSTIRTAITTRPSSPFQAITTAPSTTARPPSPWTPLSPTSAPANPRELRIARERCEPPWINRACISR